MALYKLAEFERNGHDDSDGYAVCWDSDAVDFTQKLIWTTRCGMCPEPAFETPDEAVLAAAEARLRVLLLDRIRYSEEVRRARPGSGDLPRGTRVRVTRAIKSRKLGLIAAGSSGIVFWVGVDDYRSSRYHTAIRVGVELEDGRRYFAAAADLALDLPMPAPEVLEERARKAAAGRHWLQVVVSPPGFVNMLG